MGNLLACFGAPKKESRRKLSLPDHPVCERYEPPQRAKGQVQQRVAPASAVDGGVSRCGCKDMATVASFGEPDRHNSSDNMKQLDFDGSKQPASNSFKKMGTKSPKKVTFDMNVQTYESAPTCEHQSLLEDTEDQEEEFKEEKKEEEKHQKAAVPTYPHNYRYQNCASSDDDDDDDDECYEEDELDSNMGDECDNLLQEEESFNSYFSKKLDIDCEKLGDSYSNGNSVSSLDMKPYHLANQSARDRSNYVHPALNPVENLSQWKQVKGAKVAPKHPMKENINTTPEKKLSKSPELAFANTKHQRSFNLSLCLDESSEQEVSVDASLSSWLTPPRNVKGSEEVRCTPERGNSRSNSTSLDERPILGALTVDDLKHANSMTRSPRKSPSRSPDETPIVGSVGRYWNHANQETCLGSPCLDSATKGIPNTTSKYSEDKRVNWHSTPFEVRLERALGSVGAIPKYSHAVC